LWSKHNSIIDFRNALKLQTLTSLPATSTPSIINPIQSPSMSANRAYQEALISALRAENEKLRQANAAKDAALLAKDKLIAELNKSLRAMDNHILALLREIYDPDHTLPALSSSADTGAQAQMPSGIPAAQTPTPSTPQTPN
jgi:hypothetical protein